ncbi:hypothetical protein MGG_16189 [Pyricularia oryzae 70-15]|uniref:Uncharacterized protein n=1 Tax=Pyricularia oryzae (strain 70-15 / ATCC MYA-4617 / FGSC 8958) TaxID=242507 RepID=G4MMH4_PYRO7|nr:uncharacterized protein MGG_16189 [Pyricularia oryzae 70-15]EHA56952.1 hypothetical protein MGG_16189 [Pyricularia oryzae 70-15]
MAQQITFTSPTAAVHESDTIQLFEQAIDSNVREALDDPNTRNTPMVNLG